MGIKKKCFLAVCLVALLFISAIGLYMGVEVSRILIDNATDINQVGFDQICASVDRLLNQVDNAANMLCFNEDLAGTLALMPMMDAYDFYDGRESILQEIRTTRNIVLSKYPSDVFVVYGDIVISSNYYQSIAASDLEKVTENDWYMGDDFAYGQSCWLTPTSSYFSTPQKNSFFTLVKKLWGESLYSGSRGLVIINIQEKEAFRSLLDEAVSTGETQLYLFNEQGMVISSTDDAAYGAMLPTFPFAEVVMDGEMSSNLNDVHVTAAKVNDGNWTLVQTMPYCYLLSQAKETGMRLICVLMIVGVFVALGVLLFASRLIAPVLSIAKAAQEVAKGNFDYPLKIRRKDEIGQLANTFNQMRINLQTLMAKRNQLNLELLKSQLEPHFLLNALGNIKAMAWLSGNQTVARMTGDLAYLLESMLSKNEEFVTLNQELEFTRHYVELQKVRFNDFEFIEKVDEQALNCAVPRILLQPLIENSLKHGFRNNPLGARVTLSVALEGERLCIELADNGTGFGESPEGILSSLFNEGQQEKKKVGLRNIASRLEIYYGQRAGRYEFCLENIQPKGARVVIRIPAEALANGEEKGGRRL